MDAGEEVNAAGIDCGAVFNRIQLRHSRRCTNVNDCRKAFDSRPIKTVNLNRAVFIGSSLMRSRTELTPDYARSILSYDPTSGHITWRVNRRYIKAGLRAGCKHADRRGKLYRKIRIDGHAYSEHRLAFFLTTGNWPAQEVDHIDGNGLNNAWNNLREADAVANRRNQRRICANTSGHTGVHWHAKNRKWEVKIGVNGTHINLGYFTSLNEAILARKKANIKYGFHANHGTDRPK